MCISLNSCSTIYGLRNRNNSSSSCLLSEARTRIWRTTVPAIRGEKPSGTAWQREHCCCHTRSPLSSCFCDVWVVGAVFFVSRPVGAVSCAIAPESRDIDPSSARKTERYRRFILFPLPRWKQKAVYDARLPNIVVSSSGELPRIAG
jgi:hypothetical protein